MIQVSSFDHFAPHCRFAIFVATLTFPAKCQRFGLVRWAGSVYISRFGTGPNSIGPWSLHMSRSRFGTERYRLHNQIWSGPWSDKDGWVRVLRPFNSISVISRRWKGEHERLCAMKRRLGSGRISPPAGFEPATPWSEVGSANRSATRSDKDLVRTKLVL